MGIVASSALTGQAAYALLAVIFVAACFVAVVYRPFVANGRRSTHFSFGNVFKAILEDESKPPKK
jgi:hypothetical protein